MGYFVQQAGIRQATVGNIGTSGNAMEPENDAPLAETSDSKAEQVGKAAYVSPKLALGRVTAHSKELGREVADSRRNAAAALEDLLLWLCSYR